MIGRLTARLLVGALALVLLAVPAAAWGQAGDSVTGRALLAPGSPFDSLVTIDARSGPSGENPGGTFSNNGCPQLLLGGGCSTRNPELGGAVTCLNVQGNRAVMGYYSSIRDAFTRLVRFVGFAEVVDDGSPGVGRDTVGWTRQVVPIDTPPYTTCPATLPEGAEFSGTLPPPPDPSDPKYGGLSGVAQDFVVTDRKPLPTSKADCKNGGWRQFGFKNQGQCIASIRSPGYG